MELTKQSYENPTSVALYGKEKDLHPAEKVIFNQYAALFEKAHFLDIGIGAGRTTIHLLDNVKSYVGVDYSQQMIDFCQNHFKDTNAVFKCVDARSMPEFQNNEFDVIFFSFNGIDCVGINDREIVLKECYRILKPGGLLLFSSHNTQYYPNLRKWKFGLNPINTWREIKRYQFRNNNNDWTKINPQGNFFNLTDLDYNDTVGLVYIKPAYQVQLLKDNGFETVKCYSKIDGVQVQKENIDNYIFPWMYYTAIKSN